MVPSRIKRLAGDDRVEPCSTDGVATDTTVSWKCGKRYAPIARAIAFCIMEVTGNTTMERNDYLLQHQEGGIAKRYFHHQHLDFRRTNDEFVSTSTLQFL